MSGRDARDELWDEGLKSYPDVKRAIEAFENLVGELAQRAMTKHLEECREVMAQPDLDASRIVPTRTLEQSTGKDRLGVIVEVPETWGVYCGLKWNPVGQHHGVSAYVGIRVSALFKQEAVFKSLISSVPSAEPGLEVEKVPGWPYEVHVSRQLPEEVKPEQIAEAVEMVVTRCLQMLKNAGGLVAAIRKK